jgi:DNA-binding MltR family transcriptional regulator
LNLLETAILAKFLPISAKERKELFDGSSNGPLGSFSSRIRLGYAMGLFGPNAKSELEHVKAIRNAFAHGALSLDFKHKDIKQACEKLNLHIHLTIVESTNGNSPKDRYIDTVTFITSRLRQNIKPRNLLELGTVMQRWGQLS